MAGDSGGSEDVQPTQHGQRRRAQARAGDSHRAVGDPNRVVREGKRYLDTKTENIICVLGNKVVVLSPSGRLVTPFKNSAANTRRRVERGRWVPLGE